MRNDVLSSIDQGGHELELEGFKLVRRVFTAAGRTLTEEWRHQDGRKKLRTGTVIDAHWDRDRLVVDTVAEEDYEVPEVSLAKDVVYAVLADLFDWYGIDDLHESWHDDKDALSFADKVVEELLAKEWRPTAKPEIEVVWDA